LKLLVLVIGPESTATRAFTKALCEHDGILGTKNPSEHADILDPVWFQLERNDLFAAISHFPANENAKIIVTRRSIPHGPAPGVSAQFLSCPNIDLLQSLCGELGYQIFVLVTSRSPVPTLLSSVKNRASVGGDIQRAYQQYQMAYRRIFNWVSKHDLEYFLVSAESFSIDKEDLIDSLHKYFGLQVLPKKEYSEKSLNSQYYSLFNR
jgi:hypothetical protein